MNSNLNLFNSVHRPACCKTVNKLSFFIICYTKKLIKILIGCYLKECFFINSALAISLCQTDIFTILYKKHFQIIICNNIRMSIYIYVDKPFMHLGNSCIYFVHVFQYFSRRACEQMFIIFVTIRL